MARNRIVATGASGRIGRSPGSELKAQGAEFVAQNAVAWC
jgi:hypothetical protein